jgi:four helix bundle protein
MQDYRKLRVWRKAHELALSVRLASSRFPRTGYASLRNQITASAESIPCNIVEGCGAGTARDLARFLDISIKSTMELEYQLRLASDYGVLGADEGKALDGEVVDIRRMLYGLKKKVLAAE